MEEPYCLNIECYFSCNAEFDGFEKLIYSSTTLFAHKCEVMTLCNAAVLKFNQNT